MTDTAPSGVVTFLFTDVEGSTRRWEADPDGMRAALATHDAVLRAAPNTDWPFGVAAYYRAENHLIQR